MKSKHHLSLFLTAALLIATGCAMWTFDLDIPHLRSIAEQGTCNQSISDYSKIIKKAPNDYGAYLCRGDAYYTEGRYNQAISDYTKAIELYENDSKPYNNLAWVLATCRDSKYRNGADALKLAKKALEIESDACTLDTLAASYAEVGNFEYAMKIQEQAINQLKEEGEEENLAECKERLNYYKDKKPWRE